MTSTSSDSAIFFGSLINLAVAITALVFMGILLQHNTSKDLNELQRITDVIDDNITSASDGVTEAIDCQQGLLDKNDTFVNCTDVSFAQCEAMTNEYVASVGNLTLLTVESLNRTLAQVVQSCANRTAVLRAQIAEVALLSATPPVLIDAGFVNVMVDGAAALMSANWELYRIDGLAGSDLVVDFVVLLPWTTPVSTSTPNPVITYEALPVLSSETGVRFLLNVQQGKWSGGNVVAWGGNLQFYTDELSTIIVHYF